MRTLKPPKKEWSMTDATSQNTAMISVYNRLAPRYDKLHRRWLRFAGGEAQAALEAAVRVAISPDAAILDVGCGTGRFARALIDEGVLPEKITLLDPSTAMLALCQDIPVRKRLGRLESMPFDAGRFDIITCAWALETADDPLLALQELARVLRPGGALFVTFCARKAPESYLDRVMQSCLEIRQTGRFMNFHYVLQVIENAMKCEIKVLPSTGPCMSLYARKSFLSF